MLLNLDKKILVKAEEIQKIKNDILLRLLFRQREDWLNFIKNKLKYDNLLGSKGKNLKNSNIQKKN